MTSTTTEMSSSTTGIFNNGTDNNSTNTNNTNVFPTPTFDPHDETVNAESTIVLSLFGSIGNLFDQIIEVRFNRLNSNCCSYNYDALSLCKLEKNAMVCMRCSLV